MTTPPSGDPAPGDPVPRDGVPPPAGPVPFDPAEVRRRQRARALATALLLGGLVVLFYAISIAKML